METSGHRPLATTTVALVILMGIHVVRSSFAMVVWNIGEGQSPAALLLIASGIWVAGLAGWAIVPWVDSPRLGLRLALLFAVLYAAGHAVRHPVLTPALVSASLVAWLWMMPALIGELGRPDALDVMVPGILVGSALQVAGQTALHGLDLSMLHGPLPGLGAAALAGALFAVWTATVTTAPSGAAAFPFPQGWGLFALGPYLVLQQTLLTNLGRVQAATGLQIEQASVLILLGLAAAAAAIPLASRPLIRMAVAPASGGLTSKNSPAATAARAITTPAWIPDTPMVQRLRSTCTTCPWSSPVTAFYPNASWCSSPWKVESNRRFGPRIDGPRRPAPSSRPGPPAPRRSWRAGSAAPCRSWG